MSQIKDINVASINQLLPQAKKETIQQIIQQSKNYTELAGERNKLITEHINQKLTSLQATQQKNKELTQQQQKERVIMISLLVVSLLTIGGLLTKLKGIKGKK